MEEWCSAITQQQGINPLMSLNQLALLAFVIFICTIVLFYKGNRNPKFHLTPPSPPKLPVIGHLHLLRPSPHRVLTKLSAKYGPVMLLRLGRLSAVVVSSPEAAKAVMRTYDAECATRPSWQGINTLTYNRLDVAFSPYSEYSREVKKLFLLELIGKLAEAFATAREIQIDRLTESIAKSDSRPIVLDDLCYMVVDGIIGTAAFGRTYGADHFEAHEFRDLFVSATSVLSSISAEEFLPSAAIGWLVDKLTGAAALRRTTFQKLDAFFERIIDKHSDPNWHIEPGHEDLVDVLLRNWGEKLNSVMLTRDHIKAILFDTYIGGIDTTALTLLRAFTEIVRNPRVMEKLQREIRDVVGNYRPRVKAEDLERIPYLKMVVRESIRLHPPIMLLLPRVTTAPVKIGMYGVPSDTIVFVNVWAIGRDPGIWENPEDFYPERFEDTEIDFRGSHFQFIPFGAGKRMCPGYPIGVATVELTLANLLYRFDWELPHGVTVNDLNMEETGTTPFSKKTPLELVPTVYNPQA